MIEMRETENPLIFTTDENVCLPRQGNNVPSVRRLNASEELVEWILANQIRPGNAKSRRSTPTDDGVQYWLSRTQNVGQQVNPAVLDSQTNLPTLPAQASDIEESRLPQATVSPYTHHKDDEFPLTGGCYCLSLLLNESDNSAPVTVKILSDWERLWTHLSLDNSDDIGRKVAILRTCLRFFMHEKTFLLVWLLFVYNQGVGMLINFLSYSYLGSFLFSFMNLFFAVSSFLFALASVFLYTYFYRLYNGSNKILSTTPNDPSQEHLLGGEESENIGPINAPSERWLDATTLMIQQVFGVCKSVVQCESREQTRNQISRHTTSSYSHLLNIAFKFLVRHCKVDAREINLSERGYKIAFLFIFIIVPLYLALLFSYGIYDNVITCNFAGQSSLQCRNTIILGVLTLGGLTNQLFSFILYGTMILSMIGLSYGSELAFFMIGAWLRRYSNLRRVSHGPDKEDSEETTPSPSPAPSHHLSLEEKCEDHAEKESEGEQELDDLTPHLTRDAIEQYLFIVEYLRQCGALWSPVIMVVLVYAFVLIFVLVGAIVILPPSLLATFSVGQYLLVFLLQIVLFIVFPTWSLAHVNAYISLIEELFKHASAEDFKIIGKETHRCPTLYLTTSCLVFIDIICEHC